MCPSTELDIQQNPTNGSNTNMPKSAASSSIVGKLTTPPRNADSMMQFVINVKQMDI
ncbi:hypothetical protein DPMN_125691 [Dreissena polymorpha]|uniref:Uncharacterized protein n=1 Tax=Dreissena polymorpha TaxID=45954 RepID=A0A9D4GVR5_DREPO|nr:hypothetical protein DPMN_125691 [Dreissena polymorpha]